jgi:hypothetical protein
MACGQNDLAPVDTPAFADAARLGTELSFEAVRLLPGPPLMVSDNPETVTTAQGVLWRHILRTGHPRKLGLTVETLGAIPMQIAAIRREVHVVSDSREYLPLGRCLAKAMLADTPEAPNGSHPRGCWRASEIALEARYVLGADGMAAPFHCRLGTGAGGAPDALSRCRKPGELQHPVSLHSHRAGQSRPSGG